MKLAYLAALASALVLVGCTPRPHLLLHDPPRADGVDTLIQRSPLPAGENIRPTELDRGENMSVHLIQIREGEKPHIHTRYDLSVVLVEGHGSLWLANQKLPMNVGDSAFIPRGTPHYFVNEGSTPAAAIVTFSPPFSGPDNSPSPAPTPDT
jgi:mannose-6-phosphate isomerase-like protein (cupin superfamily)